MDFIGRKGNVVSERIVWKVPQESIYFRPLDVCVSKVKGVERVT